MDAAGSKQESTICRSRWSQYSLRTLLVLVLLASIAMSYVATTIRAARRQNQLAEALLQWKGVPVVVNREAAGLPWYLRRFPTFYYVKSVEINESPDFSEDMLAHLVGLSQLQALRLRNVNVTDAGLVHLKGLKMLRYLDLSGTNATDEGVNMLQKALPDCKIIK